MTLVELCVHDLSGIKTARQVGAERIEICVDIAHGGLTPPFELVKAALDEGFPDGVAVLVRPRPGDYVHTPAEIALIESTIRDYSARAGEDASIAFVVGVLNSLGRIAEDAMSTLKDAAGSHDLVMHRAFDLLDDLDEGVEVARRLGVARILTTGGDPAKAQAQVLRRLVDTAAEDVTILASGGLRSGNVADIVAQSGVSQVHMRAPADNDRTDPVEAAAIMTALGRPSSTYNGRHA